MKKPLVYSGQEWTFDLIDDVMERIEDIAKRKYDLNIYPNQIEVITSEQMLDAYAANGLPIFYPHWSFGEQFVKQMEGYLRGRMGLAYEIVINSNPCISYLMEENTMLMQTLVLCHAAFGHNTYFKNNYLFQEWTNADTIIDYLSYAKKYIRKCEREYGFKEVEETLDAAHALQLHGVDKHKRPTIPTAAQEEKMQDERERYIQLQVNEIWNTIPKKDSEKSTSDDQFPEHKQENLIRFIEENAPRLEDWQREILRIIRNISQYFYPQMQTKVGNEGTATFWHFTLMNDLYEEGVVSTDAMQEFFVSHSGVLSQPDYDSKYFNGINPYALGFGILKDVKRVATNPTDEDREWFGGQSWVGGGDWVGQIKHITEEYKDESLIKQFLTPNTIREFKIFDVLDDERDDALEVFAIHDDKGYRKVRNSLSESYNIGYHIPDIQVVNVDRWGDRSIELNHFMANKRPMEATNAAETMKHFASLWGYDVHLKSLDEDGNTTMALGYDFKEDEVSIDIYS